MVELRVLISNFWSLKVASICAFTQWLKTSVKLYQTLVWYYGLKLTQKGQSVLKHILETVFYSLSYHINWDELQRCQRFPNPLFYEDPLYCSPSLLFKLCPPTPRSSFNCLLSFAKIMHDHTTSNVLFYLMALRIYGPNYEPWYLTTSSILLCVLHNKESNFLKVWHGWHVFF